LNVAVVEGAPLLGFPPAAKVPVAVISIVTPPVIATAKRANFVATLVDISILLSDSILASENGCVSNDAARRGAQWLRTWVARRGSLAFRPRALSENKRLYGNRH